MKQNSSIQMFTDYEGGIPDMNIQVEGNIPIFVTRNLVMFPGILSPILVGRKPTLALVKYLEENPNAIIAVVSQKDSNVNDPNEGDIYNIGVYARFVRSFDMPGYENNNRTAILQGLGRCKIKKVTSTTPFMSGITESLPEEVDTDKDPEFTTAVEDMKLVAKEYIQESDDIPDDTQFAIDNLKNPIISVNYICSTVPFPVKDKILLLQENSIKDRLFRLMKILNREIQLGDGDSTPEKKELQEKAKTKKWSSEVAKTFQKELDRLDTLNPQSPDYSVQVNYLQTMVALPWNEYTKDDLDLKRAKRILDKDHYGMEKVKDRILEYIAVLQLRGSLKSPILCLYGPPGVGKTSLGKSIAEAMKRKYVRVSLGGLHDESEIRGHRKTYIGAMPGRIIKNIQKAGSSNPVFILDEIDKVTQNTINGDPSSALLEVLDPEQNNAFHDNYLDLDYDLSKVLFIATANDIKLCVNWLYVKQWTNNYHIPRLAPSH